MALDRHVQLVVENAVDAMTLDDTGTPAVATMPVTNLQNQYRGRPMRRIGTAMTITGTLPEVKVASAFALAWHSLPGNGDFRLRLYLDPTPGTDLVYDSATQMIGTIIPLGVLKIGVDALGDTYEQPSIQPSIAPLFFDKVGYRSFQLDINAPGVASFDISRLFLGESFRPVINYSYGKPFETVDPSDHIETGGNSLVTIPRDQFRRARVNLQHLDRSERERLSYELVRISKQGQIFLALDPGETGLLRIEQILIGKRESDVTMTQRDAVFYEHELVIRE